jgi:hypothetical protein
MKFEKCPDCGGHIKIHHDHKPGDEVCCEDCNKGFQLTGLNPTILASSDQYDDDYFDDGHFDDDYFDDGRFDDDIYDNQPDLS